MPCLALDPVTAIQNALQCRHGPNQSVLWGDGHGDQRARLLHHLRQRLYRDVRRVQYGPNTTPVNLPLITSPNAQFSQGFLPAVTATAVSQPSILKYIPVQSNPQNTATAITQWFSYYTQGISVERTDEHVFAGHVADHHDDLAVYGVRHAAGVGGWARGLPGRVQRQSPRRKIWRP